MGNSVNAQNVSVMASIASAEVLAANIGRTFLQIQNRSGVVVTFKLDSDFNPARNAIQQITFGRLPDAGAWKLTFGANQTASLAHDINAATLQAALEALGSIGAGNVSVTGNVANGFLVEFIAAKAALPQALLVVSVNTLTDSTVEQSAVQFVGFNHLADGGTFRVKFGVDETADLAFDITPADLKTALNALPSINGGVDSVAQDVGTGDFTVNFGAPLDNQPLALIEITHNALTFAGDNQDDIQVLYAVPEALQGSYKLNVGTETTAVLAYDAVAGDIQAALEALPSVGAGNVLVTGADLVTGFTIHFQAAKANTAFSDIFPEEVTLHADLQTEEPQKRVEDVLIQVNRTQLGQGTQDIEAVVETVEVGVAPATMDVTVANSQVGNALPAEGIDLLPLGQVGDSVLYSSSVPTGGIWMKATADNSPVDLLVG